MARKGGKRLKEFKWFLPWRYFQGKLVLREEGRKPVLFFTQKGRVWDLGMQMGQLGESQDWASCLPLFTAHQSRPPALVFCCTSCGWQTQRWRELGGGATWKTLKVHGTNLHEHLAIKYATFCVWTTTDPVSANAVLWWFSQYGR